MSRRPSTFGMRLRRAERPTSNFQHSTSKAGTARRRTLFFPLRHLPAYSARMAQFQRSTQTSELTETFLQFIMMHTQQALLALGKHPSRPAGAAPANLQLGKVFIDHLVMLRAKMEGNLAGDEQSAITNAITHLQNAFVEATKEREGKV